MIDTATIERYMRDTNPIPHIDDLDPDEFARFVAATDTRRAAIRQAPTQQETTEPHPTSQPPRSRRAWAFAAAFILILASISIAVLALRGDGATVTDEPAPPTTVVETSDEPIDVEELVWYRVSTDDPVFADARIEDVTIFEGGLVAVGEGASGAAVWTSPDGFNWTRLSLEHAPDPRGWIREVSPGGPGLVAIVELEADVEVDTIWTSADGITWTPSDQTFDRLETITQGGPGLIVVGDGLAYTSVDGTDWTAGRCPDCSETGEFGYLADVVAAGSGLIAVGNTTDAGDGPAYVWTSPDGLTWTRVPVDEVIEMESVTAGGPGFVAVGHGPGGGRVLTSPDGIGWSPVPNNEEVFGRSLMRSVVAVGDGLVALGEWDWGEGQAWTSRDGMSWTRVPYDAEVFGGASIHDAVVFGDRLIAVGDSSVWIASPPGSLDVTTATAATSSVTSQPLITGETVNPWQKTEITASWASHIIDVTSLPDGGFALAVNEGGSILWSRDGVSWQEADPDEQVTPVAMAAPAELGDGNRIITALPGRVAVLGGTGTDLLVWVGDLASGAWKSIPLDTDGLGASLVRVGIASSNYELLVVAEPAVWLIDPETGEVHRGTLPPGFAGSSKNLEAEWFGDRWVVAAGNVTAVSRDGLEWTTGRALEDLSVSGGTFDLFVTSLTAGPDRIVATTCEWVPHLVWYSEDGLEWVQAPGVVGPHSGSAYSDALGYVIVFDGRVFSSNDGQRWRWTLGTGWDHGPRDVYDIAASDNSVFVLANPPFLLTSD